MDEKKEQLDSPLSQQEQGVAATDEAFRREKKWLDIIDEQITEAQQRGEFDNLRGRGKPLDLRKNPYAGDWEMAYKALSNAGFAPEWIERDKEIRVMIEDAQRMLARHVAWHNEAVAGLAALPPREQARQRQVIETSRANIIARYEKRATEINKKIADFNLIVPLPDKQRFKLRIADDIRAFEAQLASLPES